MQQDSGYSRRDFLKTAMAAGMSLSLAQSEASAEESAQKGTAGMATEKHYGEPYDLAGKRLVFTSWYYVRPGNFGYFNSSSGKLILDICKVLARLRARGMNVKVNWHFEKDDIDIVLVNSIECKVDIDDIFSTLEDYKNFSDRKFFQNFLEDYAIIKLCQDRDICDIINYVDKLNLKPYQKSRIKKQLRDKSKMKLKNSSMQKLCDELKFKIDLEIKKHE